MIEVSNVSFSYTDKPFLEGITFNVKEGEIFGFLGPSGAGKSTLQKILTGLITNYRGKACVLGMDTNHIKNDFYEQVGVDFEFPSLYEKLTGRENLNYFSSLYQGPCTPVEELAQKVGLSGDLDKKVSEYSKGMKSRLNFIKSLVHNPRVLFLDEPTSGLDPSNSQIMKDMILEEKKKGTTIILTTHNMLDATKLCDRVAFIVDGKMKALDTPHNLIMSKGAISISYTYNENNGQSGLYQKVEKSKQCSLHDTSYDELLISLIKENRLTSIHSSEPTLNDIFMEVTGRKLCD